MLSARVIVSLLGGDVGGGGAVLFSAVNYFKPAFLVPHSNVACMAPAILVQRLCYTPPHFRVTLAYAHTHTLQPLSPTSLFRIFVVLAKNLRSLDAHLTTRIWLVSARVIHLGHVDKLHLAAWQGHTDMAR